ncbi:MULTISPECIES: hypothetical protein [unclassified Halorhodospira]|uniref:hypothetical protein n=1 Tax=unclassified Halorhodospira TaxID=2626748 RepID=UPI001EE7E0ED|nr:hypothetical protein [Halorhodospira sp. M39old]MCG5546963.1 hypothetical protein [Halorhodospira sp. M38]
MLFGDLNDPHLVSIRDCVKSKKIKCEILGTDENSLLQTKVSYGDAGVSVSQGKLCLDVFDIAGAFIFLPIFIDSKRSDQNFRFWHASWKEFLYSIYDHLQDFGVVVNKGFRNSISCQSKMKLKEVSRGLGVPHPKSVITNSKSDINDFFDRAESVAIKTLHQIYLEKDSSPTMLLTKIVKKEDFDDFDGLGESPLYLQEFIEKKYDARCIYVGGKVISCKIDASGSDYGRVDWRAYDLPRTIHREISEPKHVKSAITEIMQEMQLDYACIDFCIDQNDVWWILDVNPFGKYMWIEMATGLKISDEIANFLIKKYL